MHSHKFMLAVLIPLVIVIGVGVFWYVQKNPMDGTSSTASQTNTSVVQNKQQPVSEKANVTQPTKTEKTSPQKAEHPLAVLDKQWVQDILAIQAAIEAYHDVEGSYPTYGDLFAKLGTDESNCLNAEGFMPAGCADPYMADVPKDPGISSYWYQSEDGSTYLLRFPQDGDNGEFQNGLYHLTPNGFEPFTIVKYEPSAEDSDGDQLSDADEESFGTDPHNYDTDGDGYDDFTELMNGINPLGEGELPMAEQIRQAFQLMGDSE